MEKVSSRESISEENKSRNSWRLETRAALGQRCGARRAKTMSFFRDALFSITISAVPSLALATVRSGRESSYARVSF